MQIYLHQREDKQYLLNRFLQSNTPQQRQTDICVVGRDIVNQNATGEEMMTHFFQYSEDREEDTYGSEGGNEDENEDENEDKNEDKTEDDNGFRLKEIQNRE